MIHVLSRFLLFRFTFLILAGSILIYSCSSSTANENMEARSGAAQPLPVITVGIYPATTWQEFSASLEGSRVIEIRPQVQGYLEKIYVDEGAHVRRGQLLFKINEGPFVEQLNNARAGLSTAKANLANAKINVGKLTPLVQNNVVSDVQLKTAQAAEAAAGASVAQAEAMVRAAQINLNYTAITAPADGYIGRLPFKPGSLVGLGMTEPLTVLSDINEIYAYFSLGENEFLQFKNNYPGNTIDEKLKQLPPVELVLPDNSVYPQKGKVQTVSGQFNHSTGSIAFRAVFKNPDGLLRSGNTGRLRIGRTVSNAIVIPQESTFELQDKVFVFVVGDSNKVISKPLALLGRSGNYYLVQKGIQPHDRIVYTGLDRLRDGTAIQPLPISFDSILKANPF